MVAKTKEAPVQEQAPESTKETRIANLLEKLEALPKGERSLKGRKLRANLRKLGFYLSKQEPKANEKVEPETETVEATDEDTEE